MAAAVTAGPTGLVQSTTRQSGQHVESTQLMSGTRLASTSFALSDFFTATALVQPGEFSRFGTPDATVAGTLAWCGDEAYVRAALGNPNVSAVLTTRDLLARIDVPRHVGVVADPNPRAQFWSLHNRMVAAELLFVPMEFGRGERCRIHRSAIVSSKTAIGADTEIGPGAIIESYTRIGAGSIIGPGAILGAEGLQTYRTASGSCLVRHAGGTSVGSNVVVLAGAVVSKAVHVGFTSIGDGSQISVQSAIGHESQIGRGCSLAGHVLVGGSVTMGDEVWVGPSVCIKDGLRIGRGARLLLGSVVVQDVAEGAEVSGNFAISHVRNLRRQAQAVE
jgi:UDP-3-O-[3-hydroxymyristoyl] glucosamine N-acyltransferase